MVTFFPVSSIKMAWIVWDVHILCSPTYSIFILTFFPKTPDKEEISWLATGFSGWEKSLPMLSQFATYMQTET